MTVSMLDISEARKRFNTLDEELATQPVIYITRHSKNAFAVVDIDYLETILETVEVLADPEAMQLLRTSLQQIESGALIDQEEVERELG